MNDTHGDEMPHVKDVLKDQNIIDDLIIATIEGTKKSQKLVDLSSSDTFYLCESLILDKEYLKAVIDYYKGIIQKKASNG